MNAEPQRNEGIQFLTGVGHITNDKRQEFILLSDTLGLSMLVTALNQGKPRGCTEATVFGPFLVEGSPQYELGADVSNGAEGEPCFAWPRRFDRRHPGAPCRTAGLAGRCRRQGTEQALRWITVEGARMLGQSERIGSLSRGKQADLLLVDARMPNMQPVHNPMAC